MTAMTATAQGIVTIREPDARAGRRWGRCAWRSSDGPRRHDHCRSRCLRSITHCRRLTATCSGC
jgi:hypothetical protein